ncbi:MAG: hypothetical protein RSB41_00115 [Bacilli bacterium]
MKKRHGLTMIISITIIALVVLSWIIPAGQWSGTELMSLGRSRIGLYELFDYPLLAIQYFIQLIIFILAVGGLYGVLSKTDAYKNFIEKIAKALKGKEVIFLVVIAFVMAVLTSVCSLGILLFLFIPAIIAIVTFLGYDKITAMLVTFGATLIGTIGSTYNYFVTGYINQALSTDFTTEIITKIALFVITFVIYIAFTIKHASKSKKANDKSDEIMFIEGSSSKKTKIWPIVLVFSVVAVLMILACTPWKLVFKLEFFETLHTTITTFTLGKDFAIFGSLIGKMPAFGNWYYQQIAAVVIVLTIIFSLVYKIKFSEVADNFFEGIKKMIKPALIITLSMTIVVITAYNPFYTTVASWFMNASEWIVNLLGNVKWLSFLGTFVNTFFTSIVSIISSALNIEMVYVSQSQLALLLGTLGSTATNMIAVATQALYGLTMFVAPTSTMLILGLEFLGINYKEWIKKTWKLLVTLLVVIFIIILIVAYI